MGGAQTTKSRDHPLRWRENRCEVQSAHDVCWAPTQHIFDEMLMFSFLASHPSMRLALRMVFPRTGSWAVLSHPAGTISGPLRTTPDWAVLLSAIPTTHQLPQEIHCATAVASVFKSVKDRRSAIAYRIHMVPYTASFSMNGQVKVTRPKEYSQSPLGQDSVKFGGPQNFAVPSYGGVEPHTEFAVLRPGAGTVLACVVIPWLMFSGVCYVNESSCRYYDGMVYAAVDGCFVMTALGFGVIAFQAMRKRQRGDLSQDPTWLTYICVMSLVGIAGGCICGQMNYVSYWRRVSQSVLLLSLRTFVSFVFSLLLLPSYWLPSPPIGTSVHVTMSHFLAPIVACSLARFPVVNCSR